LTTPGAAPNRHYIDLEAIKLAHPAEDLARVEVLSSIGRMLGLRDSCEQPLIEQLDNHLRDKVALLILDNFEQLCRLARW
jgi:hypothetical protein